MDDLISRQAAIDALKRAEALTRAFGYHNVIETIRELPTADLSEYCDKLWKAAYERGKAEAQPRKGKWLDNETSYSDDIPQTCTCSVCGIRSRRPLGDFCKWCMADMREDTDNKTTVCPPS